MSLFDKILSINTSLELLEMESSSPILENNSDVFPKLIQFEELIKLTPEDLIKDLERRITSGEIIYFDENEIKNIYQFAEANEAIVQLQKKVSDLLIANQLDNNEDNQILCLKEFFLEAKKIDTRYDLVKLLEKINFLNSRQENAPEAFRILKSALAVALKKDDDDTLSLINGAFEAMKDKVSEAEYLKNKQRLESITPTISRNNPQSDERKKINRMEQDRVVAALMSFYNLNTIEKSQPHDKDDVMPRDFLSKFRKYAAIADIDIHESLMVDKNLRQLKVITNEAVAMCIKEAKNIIEPKFKTVGSNDPVRDQDVSAWLLHETPGNPTSNETYFNRITESDSRLKLIKDQSEKILELKTLLEQRPQRKATSKEILIFNKEKIEQFSKNFNDARVQFQDAEPKMPFKWLVRKIIKFAENIKLNRLFKQMNLGDDREVSKFYEKTPGVHFLDKGNRFFRQYKKEQKTLNKNIQKKKEKIKNKKFS